MSEVHQETVSLVEHIVIDAFGTDLAGEARELAGVEHTIGGGDAAPDPSSGGGGCDA